MKINDNLFDKKIKEELNLNHNRVPDNINKIFDETIEMVSYKRKFNSKKAAKLDNLAVNVDLNQMKDMGIKS